MTPPCTHQRLLWLFLGLLFTLCASPAGHAAQRPKRRRSKEKDRQIREQLRQRKEFLKQILLQGGAFPRDGGFSLLAPSYAVDLKYSAYFTGPLTLACKMCNYPMEEAVAPCSLLLLEEIKDRLTLPSFRFIIDTLKCDINRQVHCDDIFKVVTNGNSDLVPLVEVFRFLFPAGSLFGMLALGMKLIKYPTTLIHSMVLSLELALSLQDVTCKRITQTIRIVRWSIWYGGLNPFVQVESNRIQLRESLQQSPFPKLQKLGHKMTCAGPLCRRVNKNLAARFRLCAGCRGPRYCSRRCQKLHWNPGGHRLECTGRRQPARLALPPPVQAGQAALPSEQEAHDQRGNAPSLLAAGMVGLGALVSG